MKKIQLLNNKFVLLVHCRNPYLNNAGSENFIMSQVKVFKRMDIDSIIIFPIVVKQLKMKTWGCCVNDRYIGTFCSDNLIKEIENVNSLYKCEGVFIHSLLFMDLKELGEIVSFRKQVCLYLHDFCSCCVQFNLRKNKKEFCGNALLYDDKCSDCEYYKQSLSHKEKVETFLNNIAVLDVVAPSEFVKTLWVEAFPEYSQRTIVINHKRMLGIYTGNMELLHSDRTIKIAFVGQGIDTKGYDKWLFATEEINSSYPGMYSFYHFGTTDQFKEYINNIAVSIVNEGPDAMIKALRSNNIDIVVLFSAAPETYSYTYFESLASNCFVITNNRSGNIAVETKNRSNGIVIENTREALYELLEDKNHLQQLLNSFKSSKKYGPEYLEDNDEYIDLLSNEDGNYQSRNKRNLFDIKSIVVNILYRIRFKI